MLPILAMSMLANALASVVLDKAQSAAKEHILKAIDDNLSGDAKDMLNAAIKDDKLHDKNSIDELLS